MTPVANTTDLPGEQMLNLPRNQFLLCKNSFNKYAWTHPCAEDQT